MRLLVAGAEWISVTAIKLYPEHRVSEIASARSAAMKKLGPAGAALGVAGTPSWTLAGEAVALSLVTGFLASAAAKEGMKDLRKVQETALELVTKYGDWFAPSMIQHIGVPQPSVWRAVGADSTHCTNGDEFISVKNEAGDQINVRWSAVGLVLP